MTTSTNPKTVLVEPERAPELPADRAAFDDPEALIKEARERQRRRRLRLLAVVVVVVGAAGVAFGVSRGGSGGGPATAAGGGQVFRGAGIVMRYPDGWYVTNEPLNSITDPVLRFVLSSYRLPAGADADADYAPPTRGVIAELVEEVPPINNGGVWPPRPRRFKLPRLGRMEAFGGHRWGEVLFRDHRRHFYIFIGVGRRAPATQVALMLRTLDAMEISARR